MTTIHAENPVWGRAQNPYDRERSCGGSSGGDGGLVAARCVPLAFGNDLGGSIRLPAYFNGLCGFRPTSCRVSIQDHRTILPRNFYSFAALVPACGPIAISVDDVKASLISLFHL